MDGLRAGLIALLLPLAAGVPLPFVFEFQVSPFWQLGAIGGIVVLASACTQFFGPAQFALIGDLVAEPDRARAIGLNQTVTNFALIVGPPLATLLFFTVGVPWALLLDVLSFVASFLTLLAIQVPQSARSLVLGNRGNVLREFGDGLRFFLSNTVLISLTIALFVAFLGSGCLNALNIFFLTQNLHTPARLYGFFGTAFGLGGLVGAAFASFFVQRLGMVRLFWLSVVAAGVGLLVYARLTSFAPAVIVLFLIQVVSACIAVAVEPILLRIIPRELIGRVTSLFTPTLGLASMLSTTLAGFLDSTVLRGLHTSMLGITFGPVDTIFTGAGILIILGGFYAKAQLREGKLTGAIS
jgi:MFS family permease